MLLKKITLSTGEKNYTFSRRITAHQYGVPMKEFLFPSVLVICAPTPKSAVKFFKTNYHK